MAKKKRNLSDRTRGKRKDHGKVKRTNPFEVKINKQKHHVLGKKRTKSEHGLPGVSRSKAMKNRTTTLLKEYEDRIKVNKVIDKRIGEKDQTISLEEKMLKRYALERKHEDKKGNIFSLNEEEDLTHYGQSLSNIEKFDNPEISDDEEDDDDLKRLRAKIVAEEHFGGFLTKKSDEETEKSFKEKMEEVVALSKKYKFERQSDKNERIEMTEQADKEYKELLPLLAGITKNKLPNEKEEEPRKKVDDYDIAVRSLQFEARGKATDRLKTDEEIAKEEKERLEKLEADRLRRMKGIIDDGGPQITHVSADDLHDGFNLNEDKKDKQRAKQSVHFKDGKLAGGDDILGDGEEEDIDEDEDDEEGSDNEDNEDEDQEDGEEIIETAKKELPYTFPAPKSYDDWLNTVNGLNTADQVVVIDRIQKLYHLSLGPGNKEKLETFQGILVQYFGDLALQDPPELALMNKLVQPIFNLTKISPDKAGEVFQQEIMSRQEEFRQITERKHGRGLFLGIDTLLMLKLISVIFPTSDFQHKVTTPSLMFMAQMLAQTPVNNERDIVYGLFLCNLCLEYVSCSKRFIPEVISYLHGILFLAANKNPKKLERVFPPFKPVGDNINMLNINSTDLSKLKPGQLDFVHILANIATIKSLKQNDIRLNMISTTIELLIKYSELYDQLPSYSEIFHPIVTMISKLPSKSYPTLLQEKISQLESSIENKSSKPKKPLQVQKNKPIPLKMFEPQVDEKWTGKRKKCGGTKEFQDTQKLLHKHKRELKGAVRDIRRDSQFLARHQLKETLEKDAERKRKVKALYSSLANQEGEVRALKKVKKK
ncbi:hypothetical protein LOTGIDRAFT_115358 [Lottia gigantea]|uniref:Nucleolar protein 14 n=1 Tax=Lottia gigantea TaxID=225164 RepID=V3ZZB3_LOTGI|nr:hypothetical protein LOTGIDRAFT_115358 [Lottia gigantea]ESO96868.1 hypothetical protein LOTGIDRAFT_115358 [Lottia gigantea]